MWLPYGHLITKVLEHIGFNVQDDESWEESSRIRNVVVGQMHFDINDEVSSQKPPKEIRDTKIQQAQQQAPQQARPLTFENFDYEIPSRLFQPKFYSKLSSKIKEEPTRRSTFLGIISLIYHCHQSCKVMMMST